MASRLAERPSKVAQALQEPEEDIDAIVDEKIAQRDAERESRASRAAKAAGDAPENYTGGSGLTNTGKSWLGLIDKTEGGGSYSTLFGHSQKDRFAGTDVSKMTIGQLKQFADPGGPYATWVKNQVGRVATPMGRYQFVGTTMAAVAAEMGLSDDTRFSPKVQDQMFEHYLRKRLASTTSMGGKVEAVRQAWEGFRSVPTMNLVSLIKETEGFT